MLIERQPYLLVERNLRHALAFYAGSQATGEVRAFPGLELISCGWNYPVFNSALLTSPVPGPDGVLSSRISMASIFFRARGVGWSYWACHDLLDSVSQHDLRNTCFIYGLEPVVTAPGMYTERLLPQLRQAPAIDVREVTDAAARMSFAHLISVIFDLPFEVTMHIYAGSEPWGPEYAAFIGYVDEKPVSITMVNVTDGCCGFYSVGTITGYRRKGLAEALMRESYRRIRLRQPCEACVLQSSTVGRRLYEQMGFREVTRFSVFRSVSG